MLSRRICDPTDVQCIWNILSDLNYQKIKTEFNKLLRELVLKYGFTLTKWDTLVRKAIEDGLIISLKNDPNCYDFPENKPELDERDWYCFECHKAGVVVECKNGNCHRVFHKKCANESVEKYELIRNCLTDNKSVVFLKIGTKPAKKRKSSTSPPEVDELTKCPDNNYYDRNKCISCNIKELKCKKFPASQLNHLLEFLLMRIKSWLPANITHKMVGSEEFPESVTEEQLKIRAKFLFFNEINMSVIRKKVFIEGYKECQEFLDDVLEIRHNVGVFHGVESQEYMAAEYIRNDTIHDLGEIICCAECYTHSNERINENWFCLPCKNKHVVVWAKQRGYPYWPAKILHENETHCDVRFFGGKHERAYLAKQCIQPITKSKESLKIRMSAALTKALAELEIHLKISKNAKALKEFIETSENTSKSRARSCTPTTSEIETQDSNKLIETPKPRKRSKSVGNLERDAHIIGLDFITNAKKRTSPKKKVTRTFDSSEESPPKKRGRPKRKSTVDSTYAPLSYRNQRKASDLNKMSDLNDSSDVDVYTFNGNDLSTSTDYDHNDQVTSSTECRGIDENLTFTYDHTTDFAEIEEMKKKMLVLNDKQDLIKFAIEWAKNEMNRMNEKHKENLKRLSEAHSLQISRTKKRQWCYFCEQDAIYHCCWNTAYCSTTCQQKHWETEHKKVCRRKSLKN